MVQTYSHNELTEEDPLADDDTTPGERREPSEKNVKKPTQK